MQSPDYDYHYYPEFAVNDNNATMWKAADNTFPQSLTIDFGQKRSLKRVATQFEFATYYYQYKLEYSVDGKNWKIYADKSNNRTPGSPMIDDNNVKARYLRLTVLGTEKPGIYAAVWNMKVYEKTFDIPLNLENKPSENLPAVQSSGELLVGFDLTDSPDSISIEQLKNTGSLGNSFSKKGKVNLVTEPENGIKAIKFDGGALVLEGVPVPESLAWNGSFTVACWVRNPEIDDENECLASWCDRTEFYLANSFNAPFYNSSNYGAMAHLDGHFDMPYKNLPSENEWHHLVFTFDGVVEKVYVDGKLDNAQNMLLSSAIENAKIRIGASDIGENFTGFMASFQMYDYALTQDRINQLMKETNPLRESR